MKKMVIEQAFYKGGIKHLWDETRGRGIGLSPLIFDSMLVWNRGLDFKTFFEHKRGEEAIKAHHFLLCSNNREPSFKEVLMSPESLQRT